MFKDNNISLLSGNKLIETLSDKNDMFGTIEKAKNLISIFSDMPNYIDDINMIGIYGEWGSGKTTYMNYVCKELNEIEVNKKHIYKAISFEAWKYEFDDSLHLSLMECLSSSSTTIQKDILKDCFLFLKNIALNSKVSLKLPLDMFSLDIDAGKTLEDTISQGMPVSLYGKLVKFREVYKSLINKILEENNVEKLVVCIDDLDRCEPENVINLLSMIKHFFSYDKDNRVTFICMLDKDAVSKAFLTKYGDVVKSKEYLEKIFDLNFTLKDSEDVSKLIKHYINTKEDAKLVEEFFKNMGILNPRRIIKVLNRSLFLERFLFKTGKDKDIFINIDPNLKCTNYSFKENSFFYSLLLYFVIYKEYYPDEFNKM
ncbi:MAG: KAP family P-loop NTPase fold protein, partial [Proteocatella sp.]